MILDVALEDERWNGFPLADLAQRAVHGVLQNLELDDQQAEVSILACDDARIADLNQEFREKSSATNVLSWPAQRLAADIPGQDPARPVADFDGLVPLGDIAFAYETCRREADEAQKPLDEHLTHLIVHGTLHLLGYDHVEDADADLMEGLETRILATMGYSDPYVR